MAPPPAKRPTLAPTTIFNLDDDSLSEVLLRLPTLASLVRASFACTRFRKVVCCSPDFRSKFGKLHPPPMLGFFIDSARPVIPTFSPLRRRSDPDLAAAVRGGDFFLTRLPEQPGNAEGGEFLDSDEASPGWELKSCRDGYVILHSWAIEQVSVYNPLSQSLEVFPQPPLERIRGQHVDFEVFFSDENGSFCLFSFCQEESGRMRAAAFSPDLRKWVHVPWPEHEMDFMPDFVGTMGNCMYLREIYQGQMMVFNTETHEVSQLELPPVQVTQASFVVGDSDDLLCLAEVNGDEISVWHWTATSTDGSYNWIQQYRHHLALQDVELVTMKNEVVYMCTNTAPCYLLLFSLKTKEVQKLKLFEKMATISHVRFLPYFMSWQPGTSSKKLAGALLP